MDNEKEVRVHRILSMYERLKNGEGLVKKEEALKFNTSEKSIQRDIESMRNFLELEKMNEYIDYDREKKMYKLTTELSDCLSNEEIYAMLKVLVESRAFPKRDMENLLDKVMQLAAKDDRTTIKKMIANEKHLYEELSHKKSLFSLIWQLSKAIQDKTVITMYYKREFDEQPHERKVKPVGIMFSEFYFYLIAYQIDKHFDFPTVYRLDRIEGFVTTDITFKVPYRDRFQEGEFRKRVQFMYTGELINVKFKFTGPSIQAILDRLPTAQIVQQLDDGAIFEAEVYGKGIKMWLMSQGEHVEVLAPESLRDEWVDSLKKIQGIYYN